MDKHGLLELILEDRMTPHAQNLSAEAVVQLQGEGSNYIGIIVSGSVFAQVSTKDGHSLWLEEFKTGQLLGLESVFTETPLGYELIAKTDTKIAYYSKINFLNLIKSDEELMEKIFRELSSRIIQNTNRIIEANTLSARGRICAELKRHSKPIGIDPGKYIIRPIPVFSEFALRVGSTRESVSRTVSDLTKIGVILRHTGALIISDMQKLESRIR